MEVWRQRTNGREQSFPGAWPSDDKLAARAANEEGDAQETGVREGEQSAGGPYAASAAMFRELEAKKRALHDKRGALALSTEDETQAENGAKALGGDDKAGVSMLMRLLAEVEELERAVRELAVDADEQYAKELMMFEESRSYPDLGV